MLLTANNRILRLKNDTIREDELTKILQKQLASSSNGYPFDTSYLLHKDSEGNQIINTQLRTLLVEAKTKRITNLSIRNNYHSDAYLVIDKTSDQSYFVKNNFKRTYQLQKGKNELDIAVVGKRATKKITIKLLNNNSLDWRSRIINNRGYTFVSVHNNLILIDQNLNLRVLPFSSVIASLYVDAREGLWVGTSSNGFFYYPNHRNLDNFYHGLNGLTVSSILVDQEGSTWCTTTEKGVFYAGNSSVLYYPDTSGFNKKTTLLKTLDNQLFLSTEIDHLFRLEYGQFYSTKLLTTGNADITDIQIFNNKKHIATKAYFGILNHRYQVEKNIKVPKHQGNLTGYQLDLFGNYLYILGAGGIYKYDGKKIEALPQSLRSKGRCFKVMNDDLIFVGCKDGLYKIRPLSNTQKKIEDINTAVSKILVNKKGAIYFTTRGQGLNQLINDKAVSIPIKNASLVMNDLTEDDQGDIWIASNNGLIKYQKNKARLYKKANGILSNDITHLTIYQDKIFLSSPDGLCQFPIKTELENRIPPLLQLAHFKVNNAVYDITKPQIELEYWQKNLVITFNRLHYKSGNQECLEYKLVGQDTDFRRSNTNTLSFENLAPDNYELIVYAINNDGIKSIKPIHLNIIIHPPFWKTAWFIILLLTLLLGLIFLVIQKVIRSIQKKEAEKTRINKLISESQLRALQAQMNPHFIFNAINGIQNFILNKKTEEAYTYLTKFSQLVRLVLNNSRNKELTLQDELDMLALYIDLEQLRFDHAFNYQLTIDPAVNPYEIEIPSLLIQPYVENAIWHGLMNLGKERNGQLNITVSLENNLLKIVVEDNGVGRARANAFKTNTIHHSVGLQLTQERLDIIKNIRKTNGVNVEIRDVVNDAKEVCGTKVTLYLPLAE